MTTNLILALVSAVVLGFRHGFDYDHVAAISDIASVESEPRGAMRSGLLYVSGHAATVAALGTAIILFHLSLPKRVDFWTERLVGFTLIILGIYVLGTLARNVEPDFVPASRARLVIHAAHLLFWGLQNIFSPSQRDRPTLAAANYSARSVFLIGVIHGLGAETPTQLLLFLLAANLGGRLKGFLGLSMFLVGLVAVNTLMCASAAGVLTFSMSQPRVLRAAMAVTASYSLVVGLVFLLGSSAILPTFG